MSDDLEPQLSEAFHRESLPPAPASLVEGLQRVPDAPVRGRRVVRGRAPIGLLAAAIVLVAAGALAISGGPSPRPVPATEPPASSAPSVAVGSPGVVLLHLEYTAQPVAGMRPTAADMATIASILKTRVDATGVAGGTVELQGSDRIVVELPGVTDPDPVSKYLGGTGHVDFVPLGQSPPTQGQTIDLTTFPPMFGGDQIASATVGSDQNGRPTIDFILKPNGARTFGDYTAANVGSYIAITLDGQVVSAPVIQNAIPNGNIQITGGGQTGFTTEDASGLVAIVRSGPLSFPLELTTSGVRPIASAGPS
jgi:preprotein translocase subunit SecD